QDLRRAGPPARGRAAVRVGADPSDHRRRVGVLRHAGRPQHRRAGGADRLRRPAGDRADRAREAAGRLPALGVPARARRDRPDLRPSPAARAAGKRAGDDDGPAASAGRRRAGRGMSTARRYFGTDGIRGRVGQGAISADFVLRLGNALGRVLAGGHEARPTVVIGKDTRISGYMFEAALEAGLVAAGGNVQMLGPMPTPAVAFLTRTLGADAGIVISASHNPHYDNGIKFFSAEGEKLDDATELAIEAALDAPFVTVESECLGKVVRARDAVGRYIEFCKASVPRGF